MEYVIQRPTDQKCLKFDHRGQVIWVRPQHRTPEVFRTQRIAREIAKDLASASGVMKGQVIMVANCEVRTLNAILKEVSQ